MTQDKVTYVFLVHEDDASLFRQEVDEYSKQENEFSSEIVSEEANEETVVFTVEVHGDAYAIPVFEEDLTSIDSVTVKEEPDVDPGGSKFS